MTQGAQKISPFPSVSDLISQLLHLLCDPNDKERAFVQFNAHDDTVLLINNYGGLSNLELGALTHETLEQLDKNWDIQPTKIYTGGFETSLNGPGFSITLCNLTTAAKESKTGVEELMGLLGAETKAPAWPNVLANSSTKVNRKKAPGIDIEKRAEVEDDKDIKINSVLLDSSIRLACQRAIDAEPELTKWDMEMGDGDCGEAVKGVSEAILKLLDEGAAKTGSVFTMLYKIIDAVDDMGGTLGAILGILLAALASSLQSQKAKSGKGVDLMEIFAPALAHAVESLKSYTGARVGDRTVMDALLPFAEELDGTRDFRKAVKRAENAADGTRQLKPSFGRASYVAVTGGEEQRVPDPGAWALMVWVKGLYDGFEGRK
jgi:dihydroxyacetone kinase